MRDLVLTPATGDLDAMVKRRLVRIGVTFNRTFYFIDKGVQRGVAYQYGQLVEERLNTHLKTGTDNKVHVVLMPLPRSQLLPALVDGKIDIVAAQVTERPELQKFVDFTDPTRMNVNQILVTRAGEPPLAAVADLSGREVFVRDTGTYHESLIALNERFKAQGKPPVEIRPVPGDLEDDDLLEMVNAGLIPATVVDDYLANFWKKVFPNLVLHENVAVRTGGRLAVAVRKNSPQLTAALNTFMGKYGLGTRLWEHGRAKVPGQHDVREVRSVRGGAQEIPRGRRALSEVQRPIQPRLPAHGGPGVPGIPAQSERQERGGRGRHHAGHAGNRQGTATSATSGSSSRTSTPGSSTCA